MKLLPPFLFLFCSLLILGLNLAFPALSLHLSPWNYIGFFFLFGGLYMVRNIQRKFKQIATEINTFKQPNHLVDDGLFRYSRNPIYLGFTLSLFGLALLTANLAAFDVVFFFFLSSYFVVALNLIQVASCFLISPTINQHHRHQHQHQHPQSSVLSLSTDS